MPVIDGSLATVMISSDATEGNAVDVSADVQGPIRINRGRRSDVRTAASHGSAAYRKVKADPSVQIPFQSNTDTTGSLGLAVFGPTEVWYSVQVGRFKVSGVAVVNDEERTNETTTARDSFSITMRQSADHDEWEWVNNAT